jgi:hypothetical protein
LRSRDDEIRLLELQMQEEKREIALFKKKLPVKRALDQELELYRICVSYSNIYIFMFFNIGNIFSSYSHAMIKYFIYFLAGIMPRTFD